MKLIEWKWKGKDKNEWKKNFKNHEKKTIPCKVKNSSKGK